MANTVCSGSPGRQGRRPSGENAARGAASVRRLLTVGFKSPGAGHRQGPHRQSFRTPQAQRRAKGRASVGGNDISDVDFPLMRFPCARHTLPSPRGKAERLSRPQRLSPKPSSRRPLRHPKHPTRAVCRRERMFPPDHRFGSDAARVCAPLPLRSRPVFGNCGLYSQAMVATQEGRTRGDGSTAVVGAAAIAPRSG